MEDKILKLKEIVNRYDEFNEHRKNVDELLTRFKTFKLPIVFIGEFSVGKSSLINAFLGEDLLEVDTTPTTARPCEIYYSETKNRYVKEDGTEVLELPNENLEHYKHLKIVDLPGVTSQYFDHANIVKDYLTSEDPIFAIVMDISKGSISEAVLTFLKSVLKVFRKEFIFILTKKDKVNEEEAGRVLKTNLSVLRETYQDPTYYCMVSVSDDEISSFCNIMLSYESRFNEIRNQIFLSNFQNIAKRLKLNLETMLQFQKHENEISLQKIEIAIEEIENLLSYLEKQKDVEVKSIIKSVREKYDELFYETANHVNRNSEEYVKNPKQMIQDIEDFIKSKEDQMNKEIANIFGQAMTNLINKLAELQNISDLLTFTTTGWGILTGLVELGALAEAGIGTLALTGAGVAVSEALVMAAGAAAEGLLETLSTIAGPAAPFIGVALLAAHKWFEDFKRKKVKENIGTALNQIKENLDSSAEKIVENMANRVMDEYISKIKTLKDNISQLKLQKLKDIDEKQRNILTIETDINTLNSFLT